MVVTWWIVAFLRSGSMTENKFTVTNAALLLVTMRKTTIDRVLAVELYGPTYIWKLKDFFLHLFTNLLCKDISPLSRISARLVQDMHM